MIALRARNVWVIWLSFALALLLLQEEFDIRLCLEGVRNDLEGFLIPEKSLVDLFRLGEHDT